MTRFTKGSIVLFQPNIEKINVKNGTTSDPGSAVKAKVVSVEMINDRVLYDLAIYAKGGYYEIFPIKSVDSIFVCWCNDTELNLTPPQVDGRLCPSYVDAVAKSDVPPTVFDISDATTWPPGTIVLQTDYKHMLRNSNDK